MTAVIWITVGLLIALALFCATSFGLYLGLQLAVDHSTRLGYFKAYGKKWCATELKA